MRICEIVPSLEARYGGPSRSVYALSEALAFAGHDVQLLTTHPQDVDDKLLGQLRVRTFHRSQPHVLCPSSQLRLELNALPCDVVNHHSIWLRTLDYARRKAAVDGIPLVISPRGMLSPWSRRHHRWRKKLARRWVHPGAFEAAAGWHATSEDEANDLRELGFKQPICVAPNGVSAPTVEATAQARAFWHAACPALTHNPTALFYSRLHPKKRVLELIDLWLACAPKDWQLLIVGIPQTYSVDQLRTYVFRCAARDRVHIFDGTDAPAPYSVASLFLLPSHSENFGLVVAEAMAHAVPVLVTDTTPWAPINLTEGGRCVSWESYGDTLKQLLAESPSQLQERGAAARAWVLDHCSWQRSAAILAQFYASLSPHASK